MEDDFCYVGQGKQSNKIRQTWAKLDQAQL